jgi:hypothetical protein
MVGNVRLYILREKDADLAGHAVRFPQPVNERVFRLRVAAALVDKEARRRRGDKRDQNRSRNLGRQLEVAELNSRPSGCLGMAR